MRDDVRREFEKRIRGLPNERIEAEMEEWAYDSEERSIVRRELEERRRAKDASKERRHQELKRLHWFAAVVSLIGAAASWAAVWVQWHRSPTPAAPANPLAAISPVPTPQVTSPAPTPKELVPTLEESVPPPEESEELVPTLEESVPPPEESEESVPPPEEPPITSPVPSPAEP
jgi:cytoskeletal protein RodZ